MRFPCFRSVFAFSGGLVLALACTATAQTFQNYINFAGLYDTADGWRPDFGNLSVGNPLAEPGVAAGVYQGQTRLMVGADNAIGQFYNALNGPVNTHNAAQSLASVFTSVLPSGDIVSQPQVLRDQSSFQLPGQPAELLDRFIILAEAYNPTTHDSRIALAVTRYNVVGENGQCIYSFSVNDTATNAIFADEPRLGVSANALLVTANAYSTANSAFQYAKVWTIPKANVYNNPSLGTCPAWQHPNSLVLNERNSDGSLPFSVVPVKSSNGSTTTYMINSLFNSGNTLTLWILHTDNPTVITGSYGPVSVNRYSSPPNAQQSGTSGLISTWGTRLFTVVYQAGSGLWTANSTACKPPGDTLQRSCVQWYAIDPSSDRVLQQGIVESSGYYFYAPAIATNTLGDAVLVFNGSSVNHHVGIYFTGRYHTAPLNTMQASIPLLRNGDGCYIRSAGSNTVSLHSDVTVDPIYSGVFWLHSAYAYGTDTNCQKNDWATWIGAVEFK